MPSDSPVAIITGASSGIGLAVAHALHDRGWRLALVARNEQRLQSAAAELSGDALPLLLSADVGRIDDVDRIVTQTLERFGRIDALVNNAGTAPLHTIEETSLAVIESAYRVNAIGPAALISLIWPEFIRHKGGCVVNVSTMGTADPFPGFFAYASSKAATNLMALACANEGAEHGIRAFAVAPGAVETPMLRSLFDEKRIPSEQCLTPDDVASVIVECILGGRDDENGQTIFLSKT
ncbi:MAG: SDR family oxidoreductase [Phycisphaerales bacterium]